MQLDLLSAEMKSWFVADNFGEIIKNFWVKRLKSKAKSFLIMSSFSSLQKVMWLKSTPPVKMMTDFKGPQFCMFKLNNTPAYTLLTTDFQNTNHILVLLFCQMPELSKSNV